MTQANDENSSGDLPVTPITYGDEDKPTLSHDVIATYVADAARSVQGVTQLHASAWKEFSSRRREVHSGGVIIRDNPAGPVGVEIHVRVAWGTAIPELAGAVEAAVREQVTALLSIDLGTITLYVDEIASPPRADRPQEG